MNGGLLKSVSAVAIFAAAGLFASAQAADLGGDCCADLEERVAELEATTVRKGNRKVSLAISGFVGHQVLFWDDGVRSDMYIGDGGNIFSRFRFTGTAKISPQVTAGFTYEFGIHNNAIGSMDQEHKVAACGIQPGTPIAGTNANLCASSSRDNGDDIGGAFGLRDSTVYLDHKQLGRVKIGHGSTSTDNLVLIDLGGKSSASTPDNQLYVGAFRTARSGQSAYSQFTWSQLMQSSVSGGIYDGWDTGRRNHVLYQTPTLAGFTLQGAVAEDNYWDVALRYAGEFGGFRLAAGIGYQEDTEYNQRNLNNAFGGGALGTGPNEVICDTNCDMKVAELKGSASIMHIPTGLFVTGAAGQREGDNIQAFSSSSGAVRNVGSRDGGFWYLSGGISQNFFGIGKTVLFGEYASYQDMATFLDDRITSSNVDMWGVGITQYVDAAAMEVFAAFKQFDADFTSNSAIAASGTTVGKNSLQGMSTVLVGTRINF